MVDTMIMTRIICFKNIKNDMDNNEDIDDLNRSWQLWIHQLPELQLSYVEFKTQHIMKMSP